jgi:hypothetical protein
MRASKQRRSRVPWPGRRSGFAPATYWRSASLPNAPIPLRCPNGAYTSGDHSQVDNNALSPSNFAVSGAATATFAAGNCIHLAPGFHASAIDESIKAGAASKTASNARAPTAQPRGALPPIAGRPRTAASL